MSGRRGRRDGRPRECCQGGGGDDPDREAALSDLPPASGARGQSEEESDTHSARRLHCLSQLRIRNGAIEDTADYHSFPCRLQLPKHQHLPHLLHEEDRLERLSHLPLLLIHHRGQDEPTEPLHAVAGVDGEETGPETVSQCWVRPLQCRLHPHLLLCPVLLRPGGPHSRSPRPGLLPRLRHGYP